MTITDFKPKRVADNREADPGVSGGAFDDGAAGLEQTAFAMRVLDDEERGAVLDRLAGIHELGFAEDFAAGALRGPFQADQRRIADRVEDIGLND